VLLLSLFACRLGDARDPCTPLDRPANGRRFALNRLVPWFIVGFLLAATLRSFALVPASLTGPIGAAANGLTVISMAALGLGVDVGVVLRAGARVTAAVTLSLIVLGLVSLALIFAIAVR
jgi:uncharacterized membrane protein YadS